MLLSVTSPSGLPTSWTVAVLKDHNLLNVAASGDMGRQVPAISVPATLDDAISALTSVNRLIGEWEDTHPF